MSITFEDSGIGTSANEPGTVIIAPRRVRNLRPLIEPLLGLPWIKGASGPDAFDCWGIARHVQRVLFNRDLLEIVAPPDDPAALARFVATHAARRQWTQIDRPVDGALVEMAHHLHPWHIGTYMDVDGGSIIHSQRKTGVTIDGVLALKAAGWRRFIFHDWIGDDGIG